MISVNGSCSRFLILVLFRLGCAIPVPYITASALSSMFAGGTGDMLDTST